MTTYRGKPLKRVEDHRLLKGEGSFLDDIKLPGLLHAIVLRSEHAHARILSVDVSEALRMKGVVAVLTAQEISIAIKDIGPAPHPQAKTLNVPSHPILAKDRVCYVGQPVAIVLAESRYLAQDALELVHVDYDPLPPLMDPLIAAEDTPEVIHESQGTNVAMRVQEGRGDVDAVLSQAHLVLKERFEVPRLSAVPMEGRAVVCSYDADEKIITLWTSTQSPHKVKEYLAELLSMSEEGIRVIAPDVGGGFGQKHEVWPEEAALCYLTKQLGRPVKWIEDRMENLLAYHGRGYTLDAEAGFDADGFLAGMRVRIIADLGAYCLHSSLVPPVNAALRVQGPYLIPNMDVSCLAVITNKPPTGPYRGAGGPESAFVTERLMDLAAKELGVDPVDIRRRNLIPTSEFPYITATGLSYDSGDFVAGMDRALELSDYRGWRAKQRAGDFGETLIGLGVATVVKASGGLGSALVGHARLDIDATGKVVVYTEVSPHGQGTETTFAQVAAEVIGVEPSEIEVRHGDTDMLPVGEGTFASRGLAVGGSAVHVSAVEARKKLVALAGHLLGCPAGDVEINEGRVFNGRDPEQAMSFSEVASAAYQRELLPDGMEPGLEFAEAYTLTANPFGFAAHVVVVEVDPGTGDVKFLDYIAVHDSGQIVNPLIAEGQVQGGIAQGIGQALGEGMVYDPDGQPLTSSLMDYALPSAEDIPAVVLDTLETPSPTNPLGIKGLGELPTVAAPVAVANAVIDALSRYGVRHIDVPLTAEKVWQAINQVKSQTA